MSPADALVTEIQVEASVGGSVQIVKFEYTETYRVTEARTYGGKWTEDEADAFADERYRLLFARVEEKAQAEVDRLEKMRDEINTV